MKKKIYYMILAGVIFLASCEKPFLEEETFSSLTKENYYQNIEQFEKALTGSYYYISGRGTKREGTYATGLPVIGEAGTDEAYITRTKGVSWQPHADLDAYSSLTPDNLICQEIWLNSYAGINETNEIISHINRMSEGELNSTPRYKVIKAEAQFLQALWYFNLVRIFGGVPLLTTPTKSTVDMTSVGRDSIEKVFNHIIYLLDDAKDALPVAPHSNQYGRATKFAAYGLLSKAALHVASSMNLLNLPEEIKLNGINSYDWHARDANGNVLDKAATIKHYYQMAKENATVVLAHFAPNYLMPDFTDVFYPNESSKEILFEAVLSTGLAVEQGGWFGSLYGPQGKSSNGGGQQVILPMNPNILERYTYSNTGSGTATQYSSVDNRFLWSISTYRILDDLSFASYPPGGVMANALIGKFRLDVPAPYNQDRTPVNNPILRTSEVCLIYAEAQAELDHLNGLDITNDALEFLNVVRARAGTPIYTVGSIKKTVPLTQKNVQGNKEIKGYTPALPIEYFRQAILNERLLELLGEGHRWFDLVRTGQLQSIGNASSVYANSVNNKFPSRNIAAFHNFRPIPTREISIHKGTLIQNFGYN